MSDSRLPDDLRRWPGDHFELLGVARDVDSRSLRQAYTRLIRTYNPERFPQHFQRIRQAYEAALQFIRWRDANSEQPTLPSAPPEAEDPPPAAAPNTLRPFHPGIVVPNLDDELDELWDRACAGEDAAAYSRLLELERQAVGNEEILLRLFWLLVAEPTLDPHREPVDWLIHGLKGDRPQLRLRRLYYQELNFRPAEILTPRSSALLRRAAAPAVQNELIRARWQAAAWLGEWQVIASDMELLRARLIQESESLWAGLLLDAADYLAWDPTPEGRQEFDRCCRELHRLEHLHFEMPGRFDRLETLVPIADGWQVLCAQRGIPRVLLRAISLSWTGPEPDARRVLEGLIEALVADIPAGLRLLDRVMKLASLVMWQLHGAVSRLPYEASGSSGTVSSLNLQKESLLSNLLRLKDPVYRKARLPILRFCLREAVSPLELAVPLEQWGAVQPAPGKTWTEIVTGDLPLRCLYSACEFHRT